MAPIHAGPKDTQSRAVKLSRDAAMAFYAGDVNGDQQLSYEEFVEVVPSDMKTGNEADLRALFRAVDADNSGNITLDEFFVWTLGFIEENTGAGLDAFFRRYDSNGEGSLDASEFARAAEDLGFGPVAHDLFLELDPDESGSVSYCELISYLRSSTISRCQSVSGQAKRFLTGVAYSVNDVGDIDPETWNLNAETTEGLREQLKMVMTLNPTVRVTHLYALMTAEGKMTVSRETIGDALKRIGYKGPASRDFQYKLFAELDSDSSGLFGMNDLQNWINNIVGRYEKARGLTLLRKPVDGLHQVTIGTNEILYPCRLAKVDWDLPSLRRALQLMLINAQLSPLDVLRAYDQDESGSFSKKEFLVMLKRIVQEEEMWDDQLRDVCHSAYREISGNDSRIDVVEFEVWLNVGWLALKREVKGLAPPPGTVAATGTAPPGALGDMSSGALPATRRRQVTRRPPRPSSAGSSLSLASHSSSLASSFYDLGARRGYAGSVYDEPKRVERAPQRRPPGRTHIVLLAPPPPDLCRSMSVGELSHVSRRGRQKQMALLAPWLLM